MEKMSKAFYIDCITHFCSTLLDRSKISEHLSRETFCSSINGYIKFHVGRLEQNMATCFDQSFAFPKRPGWVHCAWVATSTPIFSAARAASVFKSRFYRFLVSAKHTGVYKTGKSCSGSHSDAYTTDSSRFNRIACPYIFDPSV